MAKKRSAFAVVVLVSLCVQLSFSGWHVLGGVALSGSHNVNPFVFAVYREVGASFLMGCAAVAFEGRRAAFGPLRVIAAYLFSAQKKRPKNDDGLRTLLLFVGAGAASFCNVVGTVVALTLISSDVYSLYQPTIPVFTTAMTLALRLEKTQKPNAFLYVGILFSVAGAVLVEVLNAEGGSSQKNPFLGNLLTVGQCIGGAALLVLTKPLTREWSPLVVTAGYYTTGSLFTIIACLVAQLPLRAYHWSAPEPWAALAYAVFVSTFLAYEAYSWLVKRASATFIAAFCPMQPVFTILLNFLFFRDPLGAPTALAGLVVVLGLALTVHGRSLQQQQQQDASERVDPTPHSTALLDGNSLPSRDDFDDDGDDLGPLDVALLEEARGGDGVDEESQTQLSSSEQSASSC